MTRQFEDRLAVRERVALLLGLMGPSGGGKTFSALRLATGIQSVSGGEIFLIDTEARRALHYAGLFRFRHVPFGAPFGPLDYLAAIEHCVERGALVIVVDSMSHEHEGPGGVLEMHDAETKRLAKKWNTSEAAAQMAAWSKPKRERRRLINTVLQLPCNFIFCWRAKEKLRIKKGEDPKPMGWMPIAGEEFVYEMAVNALLMPGAGGVPTWNPKEPGERQMVKYPDWAHDLFQDGKPLSEETGARLAQWSAGTVTPDIEEILKRLATCSDSASLGTLTTEARHAYRGATKAQQDALTEAIAKAKARLSSAESPSSSTTDEEIAEREPTDEEIAEQLEMMKGKG